MKIYILNPPFTPGFSRNSRWAAKARGGTLYYPIWLAYATGLLEKDGHQVRFIDAIARNWDINKVLQDAKEFDPKVIVSYSNFTSLKNDINIARQLKESTNSITVLVGPPASQFSDAMLQSGTDIVVKYEFDHTVRDLVASMEKMNSYKDVKGISYKEGTQIINNPNRDLTTTNELDEMPFVSEVYKKHLHLEDYLLNHTLYPMVQIITGRGCPNQCTFCSWPETLTGRKYRFRSAKSVVDEFEYIVKELPEVKEIFIEDDTFTVDKARIRDICNEIKARKLKIVWSCNARANLDYESMKLMKEAGCRLLDVGYESGSDKILQNIRKGITTVDSRKFTSDAKKAGLMILADFIIGTPGETKETAEETIRFVKEIKPNLLQFSVATPIPGTEFYNYVKKNGYLLIDDIEEALDKEGFQRCIVSYPEFTKKDIESFVDRGLKEYYLSPGYVPVAISNVLRKNGLHELKGMISSAVLFLRYIRRSK